MVHVSSDLVMVSSLTTTGAAVRGIGGRAPLFSSLFLCWLRGHLPGV